MAMSIFFGYSDHPHGSRIRSRLAISDPMDGWGDQGKNPVLKKRTSKRHVACSSLVAEIKRSASVTDRTIVHEAAGLQMNCLAICGWAVLDSDIVGLNTRQVNCDTKFRFVHIRHTGWRARRFNLDLHWFLRFLLGHENCQDSIFQDRRGIRKDGLCWLEIECVLIGLEDIAGGGIEPNRRYFDIPIEFLDRNVVRKNTRDVQLKAVVSAVVVPAALRVDHLGCSCSCLLGRPKKSFT